MSSSIIHILLVGYSILLLPVTLTSEYPWTYDEDSFGGPSFWAMLQKDASMCGKGKLQSPIDIRPDRLLFDPNIMAMVIDKQQVMSELVNTGQMARVRIGNSIRRPSVNLTGGPLHGYRYRIQRMDIHFGREDQNGSEHTIDGTRFPMEIQMIAYNTDLYENFSQASKAPHGLAAVSVLVDFGDQTTEELLKLTVGTASVLLKNQRVELADLQPWKLLPSTRDYVTYEGSLTPPPCHETVTWLIVNQPIHITRDHWNEWGKMLTTPKKPDKGVEPSYVGPNVRSVKSLNRRLVRTNIQLRIVKSRKECRIPAPKVQYRTTNRIDPYIKPMNTTRHKRRHHKD